jgi:hypothetical protein
MDFQELQRRLREVDVNVKDGTLRRWATIKLITGPTRNSKPGRQGADWDWDRKSLEEAAAVWTLRYSRPEWDAFYSVPKLDTIRRVKFEAQEIHEKLSAGEGACLYQGAYQKFFDPQGSRGYCLKSYDLHQLIKRWIVTVEKVRHKKSVKEPATVVFNEKSPPLLKPSDQDEFLIYIEGAKQFEVFVNSELARGIGFTPVRHPEWEAQLNHPKTAPDEDLQADLEYLRRFDKLFRKAEQKAAQ